MSAGPRIVYTAPGITAAPARAGTPAAATAPQAAAPASTAPAEETVKQEGPKQAAAGAGLLGRVLALLPLAAGITQAVVGFLITKGTINVAMVPLLGSLPKFVVGSLVAATSMPSIMGSVAKLLGKSGAPDMNVAQV